ARIVAHDMERVFADIDADHGDRGIECLGHGVLLVLAPLASLSLAGQEHGRTIPLAEIAVETNHCPQSIGTSRSCVPGEATNSIELRS
ncbi:hypothetical protein, partial [Bradyrhizobium sp. MOS001]|uniref:hypothetical protein n=1 Tax=Bradyrhizobium sp. MOS001 TaxID=2133948 RepID=UPI00142F9956